MSLQYSQFLLRVDRRWNEMEFTTEQRVFIVETFAREETYRKCIRKFRRKYSDTPVPTASYVSKLVKKWRATSSATEEDCAD
jgi:hypothetical protein